MLANESASETEHVSEPSVATIESNDAVIDIVMSYDVYVEQDTDVLVDRP